MGFFYLEKIYLTKKGNLRAKLIHVKSKYDETSHILKITKKTSSLISGQGYAFSVTMIDISQNMIEITINSNHYRVTVGDKIREENLIWLFNKGV